MLSLVLGLPEKRSTYDKFFEKRWDKRGACMSAVRPSLTLSTIAGQPRTPSLQHTARASNRPVPARLVFDDRRRPEQVQAHTAARQLLGERVEEDLPFLAFAVQRGLEEHPDHQDLLVFQLMVGPRSRLCVQSQLVQVADSSLVLGGRR